MSQYPLVVVGSCIRSKVSCWRWKRSVERWTWSSPWWSCSLSVLNVESNGAPIANRWPTRWFESYSVLLLKVLDWDLVYALASKLFVGESEKRSSEGQSALFHAKQLGPRPNHKPYQTLFYLWPQIPPHSSPIQLSRNLHQIQCSFRYTRKFVRSHSEHLPNKEVRSSMMLIAFKKPRTRARMV